MSSLYVCKPFDCMKKLFSYACWVGLTTAATFAQHPPIAVRAGMGVATQTRTDAAGYAAYATRPAGAWYFGASTELPLTREVSFQPNLLLSSKGATHYRASDGMNETKVRVNYLEVPLLAVYSLKTTAGTAFAAAGPSFNLALSGKLTRDGETKKMFSDDVENWRRPELGLQFSAGLRLPAGLSIAFDLAAGLTDTYSHEGATIRNRRAGLSVAWMWSK